MTKEQKIKEIISLGSFAYIPAFIGTDGGTSIRIETREELREKMTRLLLELMAEQKRLILEEVKALPEMQDEQPIHMGIMGSPDRKDFLVALNRNGLRQELRQRLSQLEEGKV